MIWFIEFKLVKKDFLLYRLKQYLFLALTNRLSKTNKIHWPFSLTKKCWGRMQVKWGSAKEKG